MDDRSSSLEGFSSILKLCHIPARARFVGESFFSGIYSATTLGLVCGQVGIMFTPYGPLVPFLIGSYAGFGLGLHQNWKTSINLAKNYARNYPEILAHSLWTELQIVVPPSVILNKNDTNEESSPSSLSMEDWIQSRGLRHLSCCILAAQSCRADVEEVDKQERQRLVEATALSFARKKEEEEEE